MKQKILLVEDEKKLADTLQSGLDEHNYEVTIAYNGQEGKDMVEQSNYDLIMLDINLPFINGYELCKLIRERNKIVPIVLLTALNFTENKVEGFNIGADDYISKPFEFRELLARVKALLRRSEMTVSAAPEILLTIADLEMNLTKKDVRRNGQKIILTAKEFLLLEYLLKNKDRIVSREEIAEKVWGTSFDHNTNVIDVYVNFLRKKIDKGFNRRLLYTHVGMGYVMRED